MANCPRCSSPLGDTDRFCPRCGAASTAVLSPSSEASPTVTVGPVVPSSRVVSDPSSLGHGRFEPGTRLGSRYRIVGLLGRGGMGEVYRADDLELGQSVALKFLPDRFRHDAEALARFRTEVRLARQIAHPNVARVYDIAEVDGQVFLTMEYVDGEDLASVLRRMGRPSSDKAVDIARQLCLGLAAAHERGVLHRDLKPSNVMIDGRGRVRIMDFGLAAASEDVGDRQIVGTPAYMAPEQLETGAVSVQSDLYSLGLVLYEVCTGKRAHPSNDPVEIRRQHSSGSVPTPSSVVADLDPVFERVVRRCLETEPTHRPPSAYAVLGALPGGDPLAAALAAGETPSPDLVANARDTGGLGPPVVLGLAVAALAIVLVSLWLSAPLFRPFRQSPGALTFRASSLLETFGYRKLPRHTATGFSQRSNVVDWLGKRGWSGDSLATAGAGGLFFWSRYSPSALDPTELHRSLATFNSPPLAGAGSIALALDREGRLLGLQALPGSAEDSATATARPATFDWKLALESAGLDPARLVPDTVRWDAPVPCDSLFAWTVRGAGPRGTDLHVRAGAAHARLSYFRVADSLGSALDQLEPQNYPGPSSAADWGAEILNWLVTFVAMFIARRNHVMGRVDHRGAFRLAAFVFVATALEAVFTVSIPQRGLAWLVDSLLGDRALGHSLLHAAQMWVFYVALEPYVRRLWPRMLVSWARLSGGRMRDPMVGRDALAGVLLGAASNLLLLGVARASQAFGWPMRPLTLAESDLLALGAVGGVGLTLSFYGSVMVLNVLQVVMTCLVTRLAVRRDDLTLVIAVLAGAAPGLAAVLTNDRSVVGVVGVIAWPLITVVALFRFGLLTALVAAFVSMLLSSTPPIFDPASWTSSTGWIYFGVLSVIAAGSAWIALAGQPLFADVLQEPQRKGPTAR